MISICVDGNNATVATKVIDAGIKFPVISGESGGEPVFKGYGIYVTPTLLLINPQKKVVEKILGNTFSLLSALNKYNINATAIDVPISKPVQTIPFTVNFFNNLKIIVMVRQADIYLMSVFTANGRLIYQNSSHLTQGVNEISLKGNPLADGVLFMEVTGAGLTGIQKVIKSH